MMSPIPARCLFRRVRMLSLSAVLTLLVASFSAHAQTYTVLHSFAGETADGAYPSGNLVQDSAGNIYGVTSIGGAGNAGTIFKIDTSGVETVLYSFTGGADGSAPLAGLFRDPEGNLYGTTETGGDAHCRCGTVFKLDTTNTLTVLHQFTGQPDGALPDWSSILISVDGELYSTTTYGGKGCEPFGCGVIFKISKTGVEKVVYRFNGTNGASPVSLIRDASGHLYGSTSQSTSGGGSIFQLDPSGSGFSTLHAFNGGADGSDPHGRLTRDVNGNIHGVTGYSASTPTCFGTGCGVLFRIDASGKETVVHTFLGGSDGRQPVAGLLDVSGALYGTAVNGGVCFYKCGLLYRVEKTGSFRELHKFAGGTDGELPMGELLLGSDGNIYGTTYMGGTGSCTGFTAGCGIIFKYTP
jgi:uncharacterized repeat protein (TIGR03803 family)